MFGVSPGISLRNSTGRVRLNEPRIVGSSLRSIRNHTGAAILPSPGKWDVGSVHTAATRRRLCGGARGADPGWGGDRAHPRKLGKGWVPEMDGRGLPMCPINRPSRWLEKYVISASNRASNQSKQDTHARDSTQTATGPNGTEMGVKNLHLSEPLG